MTATTAPERLAVERDGLNALATVVVNEHTDDHGLCAVCGCAFPCQRVALAERVPAR